MRRAPWVSLFTGCRGTSGQSGVKRRFWQTRLREDEIEYLVCLNEPRADGDSGELWLNGRRRWERKGGQEGNFNRGETIKLTF